MLPSVFCAPSPGMPSLGSAWEAGVPRCFETGWKDPHCVRSGAISLITPLTAQVLGSVLRRLQAARGSLPARPDKGCAEPLAPDLRC